MGTLRVLIVGGSNFVDYPAGGIKYFLRNILKAVDMTDLEISLAGLTTNPDEKVGLWSKREIDSRVFPFIPVYLQKKLGSDEKPNVPIRVGMLMGLWRNKHRLQMKLFDVLYIHCPELVLPFLIPRREVSIVFHWHEVIRKVALNSRYAFFRNKFAAELFYQINKLVLKKSDRVLTISEEGYRLCSSILPDRKDRFTVVPACVDTKLFRPMDKAVVRKAHGFLSSRTILFTGRLERLKGLDLLLEAFALVNKEYKDAQLLLAGEGMERRRLEAKTRTLGLDSHVHFLGEVKHDGVAEVMNCADVFALTSLSEGCPSAVLEALACGLPIVSTNVGHISKIVKDGETGFIVNGRDPQAFANALAKGLEMGKSMKDNCVKKANHYSTKGIAKSIVDALRGTYESKK